VPVRRLRHGDVEPRPPPKQARGGRKTGGTSADDNHVMALGRRLSTTSRVRRRLPARVEAWFQRIEVMARGARRRQESRRHNLCWRRERPQARRTGPSAAEGEDRRLQLSQSDGEICNVLIVDLARRDWDMAVAEA
jgi:hypothetical protein